MLARNNTPAGGWVFRPLHRRSFIGSEITFAHISAAIAGLEFLGLIERAPHVRRFGTDLFVSGKTRKGASARFRATLKLTAMAREAGVDLGALAKHFAHHDGDVVVIDGQLHLTHGAAVTT
jgi:alkylation response protein AidB-like acyl-CoA dehydrogenase